MIDEQPAVVSGQRQPSVACEVEHREGSVGCEVGQGIAVRPTREPHAPMSDGHAFSDVADLIFDPGKVVTRIRAHDQCFRRSRLVATTSEDRKQRGAKQHSQVGAVRQRSAKRDRTQRTVGNEEDL